MSSEPEDFYRKGLKNMNFRLFKSKKSRLRKAILLFTKAGNLWCSKGNAEEAVEAFRQCADACIEVKDFNEASLSLAVSAKLLNSLNKVQEAIKDAERVVHLSTMIKNWSRAACHSELLAQLDVLNEVEHIKRAIRFYETSKFFDKANKLKFELAHLLVTEGEFLEAYKIYESLVKVREPSLESFHDYLFALGLCKLYLNTLTVEWFSRYAKFSETFQGRLLRNLWKHPNSFNQYLKEFDKFCTLKEWSKTLLKIVKEGLETSYQIDF